MSATFLKGFREADLDLLEIPIDRRIALRIFEFEFEFALEGDFAFFAVLALARGFDLGIFAVLGAFAVLAVRDLSLPETAAAASACVILGKPGIL